MFILQPLGTLINRNVKGKWKAKERLKRMSLNDYVHVTDKKSKFTKQIFSQNTHLSMKKRIVGVKRGRLRMKFNV